MIDLLIDLQDVASVVTFGDAMLDRLDQPRKDEATERLRAFIVDGKYVPGDRLPPERQLIELLDIGRGALRRALEHLERDGVIWRHVGKGTFVAERATGPENMFADLGRQLTPFRMMRARLCIEPALAREAAINASRSAKSDIATVMERGRIAASWSEYERQDDLFHRAVAGASDNALLLALFDNLNGVRREVAGLTVTRTSSRPPAQHASFTEHEAIAQAIEAHDPEAAYLAMRRHLQSVASRLFGEA